MSAVRVAGGMICARHEQRIPSARARMQSLTQAFAVEGDPDFSDFQSDSRDRQKEFYRPGEPWLDTDGRLIQVRSSPQMPHLSTPS